jgi:hypothetical protein
MAVAVRLGMEGYLLHSLSRRGRWCLEGEQGKEKRGHSAPAGVLRCHRHPSPSKQPLGKGYGLG